LHFRTCQQDLVCGVWVRRECSEHRREWFWISDFIQ
jgi:hypothetical protein